MRVGKLRGLLQLCVTDWISKGPISAEQRGPHPVIEVFTCIYTCMESPMDMYYTYICIYTVHIFVFVLMGNFLGKQCIFHVHISLLHRGMYMYIFIIYPTINQLSQRFFICVLLKAPIPIICLLDTLLHLPLWSQLACHRPPTKSNIFWFNHQFYWLHPHFSAVQAFCLIKAINVLVRVTWRQ